MRVFIELSYDGGAYCGWQRQPNVRTIQGVIEEAASKLLRVPTEIVGAGRTDTGVNSSYYVAHMDIPDGTDCNQFLWKLNQLVPSDIALYSITEVSAEAHARFDAQEREYKYYITLKKEPFLRDRSWYCLYKLDFEAMQQAAAIVPEYDDFTSFAKLNSNNKTNICHIIKSQWEILPNGVLCYTIRADRFLRNMVRSITGTLVDVGRGRYSLQEFREIIEARDLSRSSAGVPAQGLFLNDVVYPIEVFERKRKY